MTVRIHPEGQLEKSDSGVVGTERAKTNNAITDLLNAGGNVLGKGIDVAGTAVNNTLYVSRKMLVHALKWAKTSITGNK